MMGRGVYLDLQKLAEAPWSDARLRVETNSRLHTVYRTLEGLGFVERRACSDTQNVWSMTESGWELYRELEEQAVLWERQRR